MLDRWFAGAGQRGRLLARSVALGLSVALIAPPGIGRAGTMALSGQLSVSPVGSATYSVPIAVPPGTAGMAPSLSLNYNSSSGNGLLGVGWSLGGLSTISRCPKTMAQDGAIIGVNFDANDRFCMDGQRLVAISGTYGADGTQYRTEIESFSKIVSHGTAGSGPAWFEVQTKAGQTMEFGNTTDSRILAQGKTSARIWAVNRIKDSKSNYLTVAYVNDLTPYGQYYPSRIDYTGNASGSVAPYNSVQFSYATRPDSLPQYRVGSLMQTTVRMTNIKTYAGASLVSDYRLAYQQSGTANRSRMTSLTICEGGGSCLPATTFNWTNSDTGANAAQSLVNGFGADVGWTNMKTFPRMVVDVNNDGRPDIVGFANDGVYVSINSESGYSAPAQWAAQFGASTWTDNDTYPRTLADVNGDGLPDVVGFASDGVYVGLNTGSAFSSSSRWVAYFGVASGGWSDNNTYPRTLADVNGDGLPDVVGFASDGVYVALNTGSAFGSPTRWVGQFGTTNGWTDNNAFPRTLADVNGDGLPDIVGFGNDGTYVSLNTGASFQPPAQWVAQYGKGLGWVDNNTYPRMLADMNGDGLPDVVGFAASGVYVALSTGTSFLSAQQWIDGYGVSGGWTDNGDYPRMLADVDGDGLPDLIGFGNDGVYLSLNAGSAFYGRWQWTSSYATSGWKTTSTLPPGCLVPGVSVCVPTRREYPRMVIDPTGTGFAGIIGFGPSQVYFTLRPATVLPNLLSSVVNGIGATTTVTYAPATKSTVVVKDPGAAFPIKDLVAPFYVVSQVDASNGVGGIYSSAYTYQGARYDTRGRGFLGFTLTNVRDLQTGIINTATYYQNFPFTGLVGTSTKRLGSQVVSTSVNSYQKYDTGGTAPYHVYLQQNVSSGADLDGSVLPTATTTNQYDAYLNPTQTVVSTSDGFTRTTSSTFLNDTTNWYLGRLTRTSVTSVAP